MTRINDRASGLGRLLDQLLSRAMIIHRADTQPSTRIDLRDVAVEVVEACDDLALAVGTEVELRLPDSPVVTLGDALSLAEAGKNLLTNALRHGRPPICIGVAGGPDPCLWVSDCGNGPPAEVMAAAGTRFTRAGRNGGSGIGLAIARDVAEGHGGTVRMGHDGTRYTVSLDLPGRTT